MELATPQFIDNSITENGVLKLLNGIKVGKSGGPDNIQGAALKTFSCCLAQPPTNFFHYSLDTASLPSAWKHARVIPAYKRSSRHDPANYRPVSLTSICCKSMEHIVYSHISSHL